MDTDILSHDGQAVIDSAVAATDRCGPAAPSLAQDEAGIPYEWNNTDAPLPPEECLHQLFEAQVDLTPDAPALRCGEERLTYRELNRRANRLARHLRGLGVGPEEVVGLCMERSAEMVVALLAILKAGGAYLPLDPAYPADRLQFMRDDACLRVIVTQQRLAERLFHGPAQDKIRLVCVDADGPAIAAAEGANLPPSARRNNLAYVLYTSGSTGRPKGVAVEHGSAVAMVDWARRLFGAEQLAVALATASISFDPSVMELFATMSCGGQVVLVESLLALPQLRDVEELTLVFTVPSVVAALLQMTILPSSVRAVVVGGETLPLSLAQRIYQMGTVRRLYNLYGPTETTVTATWSLVPDDAAKTPTIGRPISNARAYVLDDNRRPVPVGVPGELYVGGAGLARGYLRREDLTAQRFILDPWSSHPGGRMYRTGDQVRWLPSGELEYLGRMDQQVKIRGFRIELGEIEAVLRQHPAVLQAVVVDREDTAGDKRLVAYVAADRGCAPSALDLQQHLRARLPGFMVPSALVLLDALPLTPNGKIDRRALPAPSSLIPHPSSLAPSAPLNELEARLVRIWEDLLGVRPIGRTDNFFTLGGDSLLAISLFARIEKEFQHGIPFDTLIEQATVEQLARSLRDQGKSRPGSTVVQIQPGNDRPPFFLIHGVYGQLISYGRLVSFLGPDCPLYGVRPPNAQEVKHFARLEDLAARYVADILVVRPRGPYLIGGWSFGGKLAVEIAQQLRARDHEVALLAVFDEPAPGWEYQSFLERGALASCFWNCWYGVGDAASLRAFLQQLWTKIASIWRNRWRMVLGRLGLAERWKGLTEADAPEELTGLFALYLNYVYKPYPGRITLLRGRAKIDRPFEKPDLGWDQLARDGVEVRAVPGDHLGMLVGRHVKVLAAELKQALEAAWGHCVTGAEGTHSARP